jgi:2-amino-4-hydroxy-6-hydroxymethyldihydropteridine diphosphokinase
MTDADQSKPVDVFLSIGSNINPEANIQYALSEIDQIFEIKQVSSVYRNKSVGFEGDDFLNMVLKLSTTRNPYEILEELNRIESATGREIGTGTFDSRTLDIDIILYGDLVDLEEPLKLPRKDINLYSFVIGPLAEIEPRGVHPVSGKSFIELWEEFNREKHPLERISIRFD